MDSLRKCIWMSAGVLNFRLCDRYYDCESCRIDSALRRVNLPPVGIVPSVPGTAASKERTFQTSVRNFYHPCHLWVRIGVGGVVRVGLDAIASSLLMPLRAVRLPIPGIDLKRDQSAWMFVSDSGQWELPSPIAGKILSRNENLLLRPESIHEGARRELWLASIRPSGLREDLEPLFYGRQVREWFRDELEKICDHLARAHAMPVGSLPDGGTLSPMALDVIDHDSRRVLVEKILIEPARLRREQ